MGVFDFMQRRRHRTYTNGADSRLQPAALKLIMPLAASSQPGCRRLQATPALYKVEDTYCELEHALFCEINYNGSKITFGP